ncbi:MAG: peptidoglycan-binding protein, partial [Proteobacteria bacterium]|nr:peptidoglycan-binding protein [Pseudomonadota bacterium]
VTVDGVFDEKLEAVVAAFQRHWRQDKVDGIADSSTITTLRDLLAATQASRTA